MKKILYFNALVGASLLLVSCNDPVTTSSSDTSAPSLSSLSVTTSSPGKTRTPSVKYNLSKSSTVSLYSDSNCASLISAAVAQAAGSNIVQSVTVSLTDNAESSIYAKATDDSNLSSNCTLVGYYTADNTAPTLALSSATANPTSGTVSVTATFSESVTGFSQSDISVTNGTAGTVSGSGSSYSFSVTPTRDGFVQVSVSAGAAQDAAANSSAASTGNITRAYVLNTCGNSGNGCYDHSAAMTAGYATLKDGNETTSSPTYLQLAATGGPSFKVWQHITNNTILHASGLWSNGWQKQLNPNGKGFSSTDFTTLTNIIDRKCPPNDTLPNVFINDDNASNKFATGYCLYVSSEFSSQALGNSGSNSGTLATDYLTAWDNSGTNGASGGTGPAWYEGNIALCKNMGMRLPTLFEGRNSEPSAGQYQYLPTGDGLPTFNSQGVGTVRTATAFSDINTTFSYWNGSGSSASIYSDTIAQDVQCVLP